jgi:DNA-binding winged helix-turn-helix (wHTH) protein
LRYLTKGLSFSDTHLSIPKAAPMKAAIHRFAGFELDRDCRTLRLDGQEIALQPRVLDLLLYLADNRERVVSKDELLDALWPGVVVTESSLQRAVSLARAALQRGGRGEAIRNYAKHGYRFVIEDEAAAAAADPPTGRQVTTAVLPSPTSRQVTAAVLPSPAAASPGLATPPPAVPAGTAPSRSTLATANAHYDASQWGAAMAAYAIADREAALDAAELERWATAAQCTGDLAAAAAPLERAAVTYCSRGEHAAAARVTTSLARVRLESCEPAVAQGCLRRAQRLLAGLPRGPEHGFLAWMTARLHLYNGDLPEAIRWGIQARDLGREQGDADIESMGLLMWGIGVQASGDTCAGLALQDEAAAAVLAGDVSALIGGIVYCGLIASCCNGGEWERAEHWSAGFGRWCERSKIDSFTGACMIHRAEVLAMAGKLDLADSVITQADSVIRAGAPWALGDAYRLLGDVYLARGDEARAEDSYVHAYRNGWDPHPGYALLLHRRGRGDEAVRALKRAAALTNWVAGERRSRYLAHAAQIASLDGRLDEAGELLYVLEAAQDTWKSGAVAGQVERARAEFAWAQGLQADALASFARGIAILQRKRAVMDGALLRLRLAEVLILLGDHATAQLELAAADSVFEPAGATGHLARSRALRVQVR